MAEDFETSGVADAEASASAPVAWPTPARTVAELQAEQAAAKEATEAEALANPSPFTTDEGGFSVVAFSTLLVFIIGGSLFFQGITGGGAARFAQEEAPEVQTCMRAAATRAEASSCLPPVPLD